MMIVPLNQNTTIVIPKYRWTVLFGFLLEKNTRLNLKFTIGIYFWTSPSFLHMSTQNKNCLSDLEWRWNTIFMNISILYHLFTNGVCVCQGVCVRLCISSCFEVCGWNLALGGYFQSDQSKVNGHVPWLPNLVRRILNPSKTQSQYGGQKSHCDQMGSTREVK